MQYLSSLKLGDYFFHWNNDCEEEFYKDLELCKYIERDCENIITTKTIYHSEDDMGDNAFYSPEITLASKLVPNNKLSKVMYPNYVQCKEVKGYLIDKKFYEIKKELDAMN